MNAVESFWGVVAPGVYVRDASPEAVTWRVDRLDATRAMLFNPQRGSVVIARPPAERPVTMLTPTMEEAVATISADLTATVIGEQDGPEATFKCPPFVIVPRARRHQAERDHLSIMHGMYVDDVKTGASLLEAHNDSHAEPDTRSVTPHVHREI